MIKLKLLLLTLWSICSFPAIATLYAPPSESLDQQVNDSTLIIKGTLRFIDRRMFFGYDENGNEVSLEERQQQYPGIDPAILEQLGMPLVDYEIIVDEVFKGEAQEPIVLRQSIPELTDYIDETLSAERIFFLVPTHPNGNTFSPLTFDSILENVGGEYLYRGVSEDTGLTELSRPAHSSPSDMKSEVYEQLIRERSR